jgi:hypothetical protein
MVYKFSDAASCQPTAAQLRRDPRRTFEKDRASERHAVQDSKFNALRQRLHRLLRFVATLRL